MQTHQLINVQTSAAVAEDCSNFDCNNEFNVATVDNIALYNKEVNSVQPCINAWKFLGTLTFRIFFLVLYSMKSHYFCIFHSACIRKDSIQSFLATFSIPLRIVRWPRCVLKHQLTNILFAIQAKDSARLLELHASMLLSYEGLH